MAIKYYELTEEKRIAVTADTGRLVKQEDGTIVMEGETFDFPDDFDYSTQSDYKIDGGQLIYDPLPEPEQPKTPTSEAATWDELAAAIREGVNAV